MNFREHVRQLIRRLEDGPVLGYIESGLIGFTIALWVMRALPDNLIDNDNWPAVVQAVGSVLAILIAIWVTRRESQLRTKEHRIDASNKLWNIATCIFFSRMAVAKAQYSLEHSPHMFRLHIEGFWFRVAALRQLSLLDIPNSIVYATLCDLFVAANEMEQALERAGDVMGVGPNDRLLLQTPLTNLAEGLAIYEATIADIIRRRGHRVPPLTFTMRGCRYTIGTHETEQI